MMALFELTPQLDWTLGEIYVGLFAAHLVIGVACLLIWNPVLFKRRMFPGPGTKTWDWIWIALFVPTLGAVVAVAVQDLSLHDGDHGDPGQRPRYPRGARDRLPRGAAPARRAPLPDRLFHEQAESEGQETV